MSDTTKEPMMWIWCPLDMITTKEGEKQNSIGPNQHINCCLYKGCTCENLETKVEELNQDGIESEE